MLNQGIYEEIINLKLKRELEGVDLYSNIIGKDSIDVEEARKMLSSYISYVTRRALSYVREEYKKDDHEALLQ
ncbi:MAG TPA: hypothetical protein VNR61_05600, partial [Niallia sp.]|nr:hypothetical protein [Niallia sp.]